MPSVRKNRKDNFTSRQVFFLLIAFAVVMITLNFERSYIYTLIKLPEMRMPYMVFFGIFLLCALVVYALQNRVALFKDVMIGAVIGQIIGTVSLSLANLFIPNGVAKNLASLKRQGFFELFLIDSTVAFILGGWLIAGIAFLLYGLMEIKWGKGSHPLTANNTMKSH